MAKWAAAIARAAAVLALGYGAVAGAGEAEAPAAQEAGQRMYREGILPSGAPMTGMAQGGVVRRASDAACASCHRRSGFGTAEGAFVVRPIAGADLYQTRAAPIVSPRIAQQLGKPVRPPYDDASLARAIRGGVDVTGRTMGELMPRYQFDDADMKEMIAYLKTLFAEAAPGVTDEVIHLATVIQPDVPAAKRQAMLDVLQVFIHDKNAGVRSDDLRRNAGIMRMHRAYRKWVLHVWELGGPPESWGAQLEASYRKQPVFALVSGIGVRSWQPIHEFSERFRIPCILPLTGLPALSEKENFYTIYFSRGISLEAEALARHLGSGPGARKIVQVYRREDAGAVAAARFRATLENAASRLEDLPVTGTPTAAFWRDLAALDASDIVLWLRSPDLSSAELARGEGSAPPTVYLSASLLDGLQGIRGARTLLTYPWQMPAERAPRVLRAQHWLRARALASREEEVQVNTYFAMTMVGEALMHLMDSFSREYFVERVEHGVTTTLMPSYFPHLSLGPDQRYASKGVYIVEDGGDAGPAAVSALIVP